MALVKSIVTGPRKGNLKLVVMSATLDVERLKSYFQSDCLVKLEGRTFPIEIYNTMEPQSDYIVSLEQIA
jgi:HrpA-like RNA helicase